MIITSPNSVQLLLEFDNLEDKERFEQWIKMIPLLASVTSLPVPPASDLVPPRRVLPSDKKLRELEIERLAIRSEIAAKREQQKQNREGLLPWQTRKPAPKNG